LEQGIMNSEIGSDVTIYDDQQVYIRYNSSYQDLGRFDKVAISGDQTWCFNYVVGIETFTEMNNLTDVVYVWEETNITVDDIVDQVAGFINETRVA
jgi:hypothetical protein